MDLNSYPEDDFTEFDEEIDVVPSTQESIPTVNPSTLPKGKALWPNHVIDHLLLEFADVKFNVVKKGNLGCKHHDLIASRLNKEFNTKYEGKQVKNRLEFMIRRYKKERDQENGTGGTPSTWQYFDQLDAILGTSAKCGGLPGGTTDVGFRSQSNSDSNASGSRKRAPSDQKEMREVLGKRQKGASQSDQQGSPPVINLDAQDSRVTVLDDDSEETPDDCQHTPKKDGKENLVVAKKGSSSLRGKKTKSKRNDEAVRGAASILADALTNITVIQKDLKVMELQQKREAAERAEQLQLQIADRKEQLQLRLAEMQMRLQLDMSARASAPQRSNMASPLYGNSLDGAELPNEEEPLFPSASSSHNYYQH